MPRWIRYKISQQDLEIYSHMVIDESRVGGTGGTDGNGGGGGG